SGKAVFCKELFAASGCVNKICFDTMKNLRTVFLQFFVLILFSSLAIAQQGSRLNSKQYQKESNPVNLEPRGVASAGEVSGFPNSSIPELISIPGAHPIGVFGKLHNQTTHGGLHN